MDGIGRGRGQAYKCWGVGIAFAGSVGGGKTKEVGFSFHIAPTFCTYVIVGKTRILGPGGRRGFGPMEVAVAKEMDSYVCIC